jgi:hypothetical protein
VVLCSSAVDERVEMESDFVGSCIGVRTGWQLVVSVGWRCWRRSVFRMQWRLKVQRYEGEWIELELPVA